jgi:hypothetical protein
MSGGRRVHGDDKVRRIRVLMATVACQLSAANFEASVA